MNTGVLTSRYKDKRGDRSTLIELQILGWRQEYSHRGKEIRVKKGVLSSSIKDNGRDCSTLIEIQR